MLAAIDLGSNSFRLHIGKHNGTGIEVIRSARESTRLASGLDAMGALTPDAMQRGIEGLYRLGDVLQAYPLSAVRAVATNTLRVATNAAEFLSAGEKALGRPIEVISGEEEARLIYMGIAYQFAIPGERRLVVDIGGGSTELILGRGRDIERAESISLGTVWQSRNFFRGGNIDDAAFDSAIMYARSLFEDVFPLPQRPQWKAAYGSSGTMRAIGEIIARNNLGIDGVTRQSLEALKRRLIDFGNIRNVTLDKMRPERADSIVGGLAIMIGLMQELGIEKLFPVEGGLRLGVMWDLHLRATQGDRREYSISNFLHRFGVDKNRAEMAAEYADALYKQLKPESDAYAKLLRWSAALHEIALTLSPTNHHKHGAYLVENADLPGFTAREQRAMARFVLGQKGNLRKLGGFLEDQDIAKAVLAMRLAVIFTHARIDVDFSQLRLRMKNKIELELKRDMTVEHPTLPHWIEREKKFWDEVGIGFSLKTKS